MKVKPIATAPKDRPILLKVEEGWIQASWIKPTNYSGEWDFITLPEHGCGCCFNSDSKPTHWMELPK
jgi:hypothetical protein